MQLLSKQLVNGVISDSNKLLHFRYFFAEFEKTTYPFAMSITVIV